MTIEREEPGVWRATCDSCGDAITLDTPGDEPMEVADAELEGRGWERRPLQVAKFATDWETRKYTVEYREHDCPDCA